MVQRADRGGEQQNRIIGVVGRKGTGKSFKTREILHAMALADPEHVRIFVYDTMGEHRWIPDTFEQQDQAVMYLMESFTYPSFLARYVPETDDEEADFSEVCNEVYNQGNMLFVVEEVVMLGCSPGYSPPKLRRITRLGRHQNIDLLYTTQRLEEAPRSLTSATDIFVIFAHTEPTALERIEKRCGAEVANLVANLRDHDFVIYDVNEKKLVSVVDCGAMVVPISSPQLVQPKQQPIEKTA